MKYIKYFLVITLLLSLFSCIPPKEDNSSKSQSSISYSDTVSYEVEGEGEDYFKARNDAIEKGVVKGIIEIIGKDKFNAYGSVIKEKILDRKKIVNEVSEFTSTSISDRDGKKVVGAIVKVNKNLLKKYLDLIDFSSYEISTKEVKATYKEKLTKDEEYEVGELKISKDSPIVDVSFLVFVPSEKLSLLKEDEDYKIFLEMVNSKISEYGLDYTDFKKAMDLSKKFYLVYEEKSGESMSLAQNLAQEVKADVYIEVDLDINPTMVSGNYVEIVMKGSIKAYDSSTGRGLGIVTFSETGKSTKGLSRAKIELIEKIVNSNVPKLLKNVQDYFSKGLRISVKIIGFKNISEEKTFSTIIDSLPGIVEKKRKSISGNVSEYEITYKGGLTTFIEDIIDALANDPKYSRSSIDQSGNSVIINIK